jgi:putative ABC transport system ATP-binding protein
VLRLEGVDKSFTGPGGDVRVLRRVDLDIQAADFALLTGPSGSGKTTLLNLAALLDIPTRGRVVFEGHDTADLDEPALCALRRERIGMVFQQFNLLSHRTAFENVLFRFRYLRVPHGVAQQAARNALATVGLSDAADRPARVLSGGEMQRVSIARALAQRPALLLADEPTGNLDRRAAHGVMDTLSAIHADGIGVVLVTHNEALLPYATRHLVCQDGQVAEVSS